MIKVIMYTKENCPNCKRAKFMFEACPVEIELKEYNINKDYHAQQYLIDKGIMSVPSFEINGKIIEGFNEGKIMEELGL